MATEHQSGGRVAVDRPRVIVRATDELETESQRGVHRARAIGLASEILVEPHHLPRSESATPRRTPSPAGLSSLASGPATPVMPTPIVALNRSRRADGHRLGHLRADRAMRDEEMPADAEVVGFDVVGVGDDPAADVGR